MELESRTVMIYFYPAKITTNKDGCTVQFIDFEGCITEGKDRQEATENAHKALKQYIKYCKEEGIKLPKPSTVSMEIIAVEE